MIFFKKTKSHQSFGLLSLANLLISHFPRLIQASVKTEVKKDAEAPKVSKHKV